MELPPITLTLTLPISELATYFPLASAAGLVQGLYVFMLATFLGFELINKVPPTLHTPLMSGANAISGITIVGALECAHRSEFTLANLLGLVAVALAMVNVVGGFFVTDRMLAMFKRR